MHRLATLILGLTLAGAAAADAPPREIIVTGEGRVEAPPDIATVTTGVETRAETAEAALAANSRIMTDLLAVIEDEGIARRDVQTSQISLSPLWSDRRGPQDDGRPPEIVGYLASNLVTVRMREIGRLGAVLDALGRSGANRISGIGFELAEPREHEDAAREEAVADARAKAELFASAAGVGLGDVVTIRETGPLDRPFPQMRAEMAMDVPVAEGSLAFTAMVEIVYAIEE